jgi:propanol-preferring alcohol dehydrogenase
MPRLTRALVAFAPRKPLQDSVLQLPDVTPLDIVVRVLACGVCRTDVHIFKGELSPPSWPVVLGHQIVGEVVEVGNAVPPDRVGQRVGIPWVGSVCGACRYCTSGQENLCPNAQFTGFHRFGGFSQYVVADSRFAFPLDANTQPVMLAPLLCAGLIGYRAYRTAQPAKSLGLIGYGSAAHLIAQVAIAEGIAVSAFTRPGDTRGQQFARSQGVVWAGSSDEAPPEPLDAAIIFASSGELVPGALGWIRPGGRVVCAGIYLSDIPSFPYDLLSRERSIMSVSNLTRRDAEHFLPLAQKYHVTPKVTVVPLGQANEALGMIEAGAVDGSVVVVPEDEGG